jgi:uncharacterized protein (TIRG00374 family)
MADFAEHDSNRGWRARVGQAVRLLICAAAVAWLYRTNDWHKVREILATANWRLVLAGLLAFSPVTALIALRLKWLLAVHDVHLPIWDAIKVTFAGNFVIQALPVGTSGGDAIKAWYIARQTPYKHEAVITVFFDRVIGLAGLLLLSGTMVLLNWNNPALAIWGRKIGLGIVVLAFGGGIYFSHWTRQALHLEQIIARLPFSAHLRRIDQAVFEFRSRHRRVAGCLALAIALQVVAIFAVFLCGWALGVVGGHPLSALPIYLAYVPICFVAGGAPIGVMEVTYQQLFAQAAHLGSPEAAMFLSLLSRFIQLVWALPGGLVFLTGRVSLTSAQEEVSKEAEIGT